MHIFYISKSGKKKNGLVSIYNRHPEFWTLKELKSFWACIRFLKCLQFLFKWWQVMHGWKSKTSLSCSMIHRKIKYTFHKKILHICALKGWLSNSPRTQTCLLRREGKKALALFYFSLVPIKCFSLQNCSWPLLQRIRRQSPRNKSIKLRAPEV